MAGVPIGGAAERAGLPVKTVRYYADIGLVVPGGRSDGGYRLYDAPEIARLAFVRRARAFGFSVEECRRLLDLHDDRARASADVKAIADAKLVQIDARLADMIELRNELRALADGCPGDAQPDCLILEAMAER